jgi:hypothetical protein
MCTLLLTLKRGGRHAAALVLPDEHPGAQTPPDKQLWSIPSSTVLTASGFGHPVTVRASNHGSGAQSTHATLQNA